MFKTCLKMFKLILIPLYGILKHSGKFRINYSRSLKNIKFILYLAKYIKTVRINILLEFILEVMLFIFKYNVIIPQ